MPSINSNTGAMYSVNATQKSEREMTTSMKRLSTGERITNAGDDAAGAAISDRMLSQVKGLECQLEMLVMLFLWLKCLKVHLVK